MSGNAVPVFGTLTQHACLALLARNRVGRLAFSFHDRVDIQPLHYVYEAGWIYGRTSEGAKLATLAHHRWVAFEVDEVRGAFDWDSVVVQGSFERLDPDGSPSERMETMHAARVARVVVPEALTAADPAPFRTVLFRIALGDITGRFARPAAAESVGAQGKRMHSPDVPDAPPNARKLPDG